MPKLKPLPYIDLPSYKAFHKNGKPMRGKALADATVRNAKILGLIPSEGRCTACDKFVSGHFYQHHHDFRRNPCRVIPLCTKCHNRRHRALGWGVGGRKFLNGRTAPKPVRDIEIPPADPTNAITIRISSHSMEGGKERRRRDRLRPG